MKDQIRQIDKEYGFNLSEDEIESIAKQAEETHCRTSTRWTSPGSCPS